MNNIIPVINTSMDLAECRDSWFFDDHYKCWCLEDVLYSSRANVPAFQRLSIFAPEGCMTPDGIPTEDSRQVPVVFENNAAGYMQMPHTWLGGPRCYAEQYLNPGLMYITCCCRGRDSRDANGHMVRMSPITLIVLKTAIRFLRHNKAALPGDFDKIISVGWSAGGAMSTLLGVTGDNPNYIPYLEAAGAFMDESDAVYASQIYCPIIDLEHADAAYEWCFGADNTCEDSPAGPAETMTPFKEALSSALSGQYIQYINSLNLHHPETGIPLTLESRRQGTFHDYLMDCLNQSATKYLSMLQSGALHEHFSVEDYLTGHYTYPAPAPRHGVAHHAGQEIDIPDKPERPMGLGEMMFRPPKGFPVPDHMPEMTEMAGNAKPWLTWDGRNAVIASLDSYILHHRRRMKPCTSFDKLSCDSGENQEFGTHEQDFVHFNPSIGEAIRSLETSFPSEAGRYADAYSCSGDNMLSRRVYLLNPMNFIGTNENSRMARHFRIRVGASDADTAFSVSMLLAIRLANAGFPVDYALVWDKPHSEADYSGEVLEWIDSICKP